MDNVTTDKITGILDKLIFLFFAALIFLLPISNSGIEISFGCILAGMILKAALKPPSFEQIKKFFTDRVNLAVLVFYLCIGLSLFASGPLFEKSLRAWMAKWGEGVLLFYLARLFLKKEHLKPLLFVFLGTALLVCFDGLYQKVTGADFLRGFEIKEVGGRTPIRATFGYHPDFATYLITAFFINLGVFFSVKKKWVMAILVFSAVMIAVNIVFTYSRGAWLAFLMVCLFLGLFIPDKRSRSVILAMAGLFLLGILVSPALRQRFMFMMQKGGDAGRFRIWKVAFSMFRESPVIGSGLGLFMDNFSKYSTSMPQYAHNCYLQVLAETGILGLVSFLWMLWEIIIRACSEIRKKVDMVQLGLFSGFLAFLIHAFFDTQLYSLKLSILFWVMASFLVVSTGSLAIARD
ncbi:MAG: O-antigen ligase family protein [Candidatus Omnitrophota bacterium]